MACCGLIAQGPPQDPDELARWSRETYDGAYESESETVFSQEPNAFLVDVVSDLKPGRALDVGMGSGRNALFLARHGWQVTGFDIATAGVEIARSKAAAEGVKLKTIVAGEADFDFGDNLWDLIVLTYQPFRHLISRVEEALKDGGLVVVENFHQDTKRYRLMGDGAVGDNEALKLFSRFRILRYEDVLARPDWGIEFPVNRLIRVLAQKPQQPLPGCHWKGDDFAVGEAVSWGLMRLKCGNSGWESAGRE